MSQRILKKEYLAAQKTIYLFERQELERNKKATVYCNHCVGKVDVSDCDMFHPYKMEEERGYPVHYKTWYYNYELTCMCGEVIDSFEFVPDKYDFLKILPLNIEDR